MLVCFRFEVLAAVISQLRYAVITATFGELDRLHLLHCHIIAHG